MIPFGWITKVVSLGGGALLGLLDGTDDTAGATVGITVADGTTGEAVAIANDVALGTTRG